MSELLPCPFCGGEAELYGVPHIPKGWDFIPRCKTTSCCGRQTKKYSNRETAIAAWNRRAQPEITGETSDGYHTFNELYHHRAVLFSVICNSNPEIAWKSKLHHDGTMYDGMFIVGVETPDGQATYHYDIDPYWEMFDVQELPKAPEWDGHTPTQAIERIGKLRAQPENEPLTLEELILRCTPKAAELLKRGLFGAVKVCAVGETIQKTNADRIRRMTDEELAEFLSAAYFDGFNDGLIHRVEPHKYTIDWLKSPAETEGTE